MLSFLIRIVASVEKATNLEESSAKLGFTSVIVAGLDTFPRCADPRTNQSRLKTDQAMTRKITRKLKPQRKLRQLGVTQTVTGLAKWI